MADASETAAAGWWDDPITDPNQDSLGRKSFATNAARLIHDNHSPASSVVYGLEGPWGSGKSSVISMAVHYLTTIPEGRWKVVQTDLRHIAACRRVSFTGSADDRVCLRIGIDWWQRLGRPCV
jgi:hypothetical protein